MHRYNAAMRVYVKGWASVFSFFQKVAFSLVCADHVQHSRAYALACSTFASDYTLRHTLSTIIIHDNICMLQKFLKNEQAACISKWNIRYTINSFPGFVSFFTLRFGVTFFSIVLRPPCSFHIIKSRSPRNNSLNV